MFDTILVTGGYGFLGQYLIKALLDEWPKTRIRILDLGPPKKCFYDFTSHPQVINHFSNICNSEEILSAFERVDLVIHLAGLVNFSVRAKQRLFQVNVRGTENVLNAMRQQHVSRLIHISSVAAFGYRKNSREPIDETFSFNWNIAERHEKYYILTKHVADVKVLEFRQKGIDSLILHPSLMFGPGDFTNSIQLLRAIKGGRIPYNMPGGNSVIHVQDVAEGIIAAMKSNKTNDNFLLSGYNYSFVEMNKIIADILEVPPPKRNMPRVMHNVIFPLFRIIEKLSPNELQASADSIDNSFRFRFYDNSKAREHLGWVPRISFEQTIIDMKKWMDEHDLFEK